MFEIVCSSWKKIPTQCLLSWAFFKNLVAFCSYILYTVFRLPLSLT